jgi:hypothetical protein
MSSRRESEVLGSSLHCACWLLLQFSTTGFQPIHFFEVKFFFPLSQYTRINGSRILRPPVQDCLPTHLHQQMGQWLARCAQCQRLYVPQSAIECFHRVQLRQFISSTLIGPSPAFVRLQLCQTCPKSLKAASRMHQIARRNVRPQQNPIPQDPFAHFRL